MASDTETRLMNLAAWLVFSFALIMVYGMLVIL